MSERHAAALEAWAFFREVAKKRELSAGEFFKRSEMGEKRRTEPTTVTMVMTDEHEGKLTFEVLKPTSVKCGFSMLSSDAVKSHIEGGGTP